MSYSWSSESERITSLTASIALCMDLKLETLEPRIFRDLSLTMKSRLYEALKDYYLNAYMEKSQGIPTGHSSTARKTESLNNLVQLLSERDGELIFWRFKRQYEPALQSTISKIDSSISTPSTPKRSKSTRTGLRQQGTGKRKCKCYGEKLEPARRDLFTKRSKKNDESYTCIPGKAGLMAIQDKKMFCSTTSTDQNLN